MRKGSTLDIIFVKRAADGEIADGMVLGEWASEGGLKVAVATV